MNYTKAFIAFGILTLLSPSIYSQQERRRVEPSTAKRSAAQVEERNTTVKSGESLRIELTGRLDSVAGNIVAVDSPDVRSRLFIHVADAYWSLDKDRARVLFTRGFDEIEKVSGESSANRDRAIQRRDALRQEALIRIARRDPELAGSLMAKALESQKKTAPKSSQMYGHGLLSESLIRAAQKLLDTDLKQSVTVATVSLTGGLSQSLRFYLIDLRAKDSKAADALAGLALKQAASQHPGNLYDVLLLWEYAFQPAKFYFGNISWEREPAQPVYPTPNELKQETLQFAATALEENVVQRSSQLALGSSSEPVVRADLLHSVIQQVLPFIEAEIPAAGSSLRVEVETLEKAIRASGEKLPEYVPAPSLASGGIAGGTTIADDLLQQAEKEVGNDARDSLYFRAAYQLLLEKKYDRAASAASSIKDGQRKSSILEVVYFNKAGELLSTGDLTAGLQVARKIENEDVRALLLARIGMELCGKKDQHADELLSEVEYLGRHATASLRLGDALLGVTYAYQTKHDKAKAFEALSSTITIINKVEIPDGFGFLGSSFDGTRALRTTSVNMGSTSIVATYPKIAGCAEVFIRASKDNFDEAISLAQQVRAKSLSLALQASICGAWAESPALNAIAK